MSAGQSAPAIDAKALEAATDTHVFNSKGEKVRFGDIFADQKTVVVFVRAYDANSRCDARIVFTLTSLFCHKGISSVGYDPAPFSVAVLSLADRLPSWGV